MVLPQLTSDLCSKLLSVEGPLARRDWLEFMVGVAAVCVMTGSSGGGGGGMEAFGFRRPLGLSIIAWILSSARIKHLELQDNTGLLQFGKCRIFAVLALSCIRAITTTEHRQFNVHIYPLVLGI